ncbi:MAG: DUF4332 domain-containing protein [Candidatus Saccharimonas sp.]
MVSVNQLTGVTPKKAEALAKIGIRTTKQLLEQGATSGDRLRLADELHTNHTTVDAWVHQADLFRLPDIIAAHVVQLCAVGVCTAPKLAYQHAGSLHKALKTAHTDASLPTIEQLSTYIAVAKTLPKIIQH